MGDGHVGSISMGGSWRRGEMIVSEASEWKAIGRDIRHREEIRARKERAREKRVIKKLALCRFMCALLVNYNSHRLVYCCKKKSGFFLKDWRCDIKTCDHVTPRENTGLSGGGHVSV